MYNVIVKASKMLKNGKIVEKYIRFSSNTIESCVKQSNSRIFHYLPKWINTNIVKVEIKSNETYEIVKQWEYKPTYR